MAVPGFYIARHPWLQLCSGAGASAGLFKVGHTGDLRARLTDGAYVTCFPPGWSYFATYETASKEAAWVLESAVLDCARAHRLEGRELVALPAPTIVQLASDAAAALDIAGSWRTAPVYPSIVRPSSQGAGGDSGAGLYTAELSRAVAHLHIPSAPAAGGAAEAPAATEAPHTEPPYADTPAHTEAAPHTEAPPHEDTVYDDDAIDAPPPELEDLRLEMRPYQVDAVADCELELESNGRAILQMACRSGKTFVAYRILAAYLARGADVVFMVPSLALLAQTAQKLVAYLRADGVSAQPLLLVGSAARAVPLPGGAAHFMTTDETVIADFLSADASAARGRLVVSTYQSSPKLPLAFALAVFDEAHRTAGPCSGPVRPTADVLLRSAAAPSMRCLFMSATPAFDVRVSPTTLSMRDTARYGVVAYHYHLRQGIAAGYITDFRIEFVGGCAPAAATAAIDAAAAKALAKDIDKANTKRKKLGAPMLAPLDAAAEKNAPRRRKSTALAGPELDLLARQVAAAMGTVDRLLVFCRTVADAEALCARTEEIQRADAAYAPFACVSAHSYRPAAENVAALRLLRSAGDARVALFNCRLFQEGTEVPPLEGVFFAAPRTSVRDIMQIVCRALNLWPGKAVARVFLPVAVNCSEDLASAGALARFARVTPVLDALIQEDPQLFNHLLDPERAPYPLGWVSDGGPAAAGLTPAHRAALLAGVRRVLRRTSADVLAGVPDSAQRLLTPTSIPWEAAFTYLRDCVLAKWRRYPKASDDLMEYGDVLYDFSKWMKLVRRRWRGESNVEPLSAAQRRDLASLPGWDPYGIEGPYPIQACLDFLGEWLATHDGVPPMVEINKGGYVGLDATMVERLSGLLMQANQIDTIAPLKKPLRECFSAERRVIYDRLVEYATQYNLVWPKPRLASGRACRTQPTFIQAAYSQFKAEYARKKAGGTSAFIDEWFPGYPHKHARQEDPETIRNGGACRRQKTKKPRARRAN